MPASRKTAAKAAAPRKSARAAKAAPAAAKKAAPAAAAAAPTQTAKVPKAAKAIKPAKAEKADKGTKADKVDRKPKLVRDSFTIPKNEYVVLEELKLRAARLGRPVKKSEVLRAGVMALRAMGDAGFLASVTAVPAVKTGRPGKSAS